MKKSDINYLILTNLLLLILYVQALVYFSKIQGVQKRGNSQDTILSSEKMSTAEVHQLPYSQHMELGFTVQSALDPNSRGSRITSFEQLEIDEVSSDDKNKLSKYNETEETNGIDAGETISIDTNGTQHRKFVNGSHAHTQPNEISHQSGRDLDATSQNAIYTFRLGDTSLPPASIEPVVAPIGYINSLPSKEVRGKLIDSVNVWVQAPPAQISTIKSVIADVHNLSLMLDDVQDNSPMRRGQPSTHCVFGMPQTVNSATYQIVDVISRTWELGDAASLGAILDEMKRLLVGQGHDLLWTNLVTPPTIDEYLRMVDGKTGGLFRMISRLMIAQSKAKIDASEVDRLMTLFGRFFQIRDDYANLASDQYTKAKGFCEDLDEGKYSFILIHAFENASPRIKMLLQNLLVQRRAIGSVTIQQKELIITLLHEIGSLQYTVEALRLLFLDLENEIRFIESCTGTQNPDIWKLLETLRV